jgi:hypothetical protein
LETRHLGFSQMGPVHSRNPYHPARMAPPKKDSLLKDLDASLSDLKLGPKLVARRDTEGPGSPALLLNAMHGILHTAFLLGLVFVFPVDEGVDCAGPHSAGRLSGEGGVRHLGPQEVFPWWQ